MGSVPQPAVIAFVQLSSDRLFNACRSCLLWNLRGDSTRTSKTTGTCGREEVSRRDRSSTTGALIGRVLVGSEGEGRTRQLRGLIDGAASVFPLRGDLVQLFRKVCESCRYIPSLRGEPDFQQFI